VKNWKDASQVRRWLTVGMLEAERRSHKLEGAAHLKQLKASIHELITNPNQTKNKTTKINSKKMNSRKLAA
jgi:hypothetical protein